MDQMIAAKKIRLIMRLRSAGITDTNVLGAIERIPREEFIPAMFHDKAYEDMALPIGRGQTISQPQVVAAMTQALEVAPRHKVLEIGTGSGYQAAVLAKLCRRLYSIERHRPLSEGAQKKLDQLRIHNITLKVGDGFMGWPEQKPFDRIIVTAAALGEPPPRLVDQLAIDGIMVVPIGTRSDDQHLVRYIKTDKGLVAENLMAVRFVPMLPNVAKDNEIPAEPDQHDLVALS